MTTNDNKETRSYESILADNKRLHDSYEILQLQVAQMRQTIADYERAQAVAEAMAANNDMLRSEIPPIKPLAKLKVKAQINKVRHIKVSRPPDWV